MLTAILVALTIRFLGLPRTVEPDRQTEARLVDNRIAADQVRIRRITEPALEKRWEILTHERADWERKR